MSQSFQKNAPKRGRVPVILSALFIAGSCIGAGMLGLPISTGLVGFMPTSLIMLMVWWFMLLTAKLLVEGSSAFSNESVTMLTLSEKVLGSTGQYFASILFLFLFYLLLTAYLIKSGELLDNILIKKITLPSSINGSFLLVVFSIFMVGWGSNLAGMFNAIFMIILFTSFFLLLATAVPHVKYQYWQHQSFQGSWALAPYLITSFGFHNMIPSIRNYLNFDDKKLIQAIHLGAILPLLIYLLWIFVVLGVLPLNGDLSISHSFENNEIATEPLGLMTGSAVMEYLGLTFAFSAMMTSILGQGLSMVDFFEDFLNRFKLKSAQKIVALLLTFVPPLLLSYLGHDIFFKCLSFAGGFAAILLYGFLPGLIVYIGRYRQGWSGTITSCRTKLSLFLIMTVAVFIFFLECIKTCFSH